MPRKSSAAFERDLFVKKPPADRSSPTELSDNIPATVRQLMEIIIDSQPAEHWEDADRFLIEQHAQSILAAREAHAHLQKEGYILKDGRQNRWLLVWEKATRATIASAAKLRLAPQQRYDAKRAARELHEKPTSLGISYRQLRDR
jgi:hypothetical protein